jgi:hypothetical protein
MALPAAALLLGAALVAATAGELLPDADGELVLGVLVLELLLQAARSAAPHAAATTSTLRRRLDGAFRTGFIFIC